jgi:hypothetical protein
MLNGRCLIEGDTATLLENSMAEYKESIATASMKFFYHRLSISRQEVNMGYRKISSD